MAKRVETKVVTNVVRLSYANLFEPKSIDGGEAKYSVSLIISKDDKETLKLIEEAIDLAKKNGKGSKFGGKVPAVLKMPLRDGDEERPDDEAYANSYFLNASSSRKPAIVSRRMELIDEPEEVYSGCYANVSVNFYPFNVSGNKGIAAGLNGVQKVKEGDRLGNGYVDPAKEFEILDDVDDLNDEDDFLA